MAAMLASMLCLASSGSLALRRLTNRAHSLPAADRRIRDAVDERPRHQHKGSKKHAAP